MRIAPFSSSVATSELSASLHCSHATSLAVTEAMFGPPEPYPSPYIQSEGIAGTGVSPVPLHRPQTHAHSQVQVASPPRIHAPVTPSASLPANDVGYRYPGQVHTVTPPQQACSDLWASDSAVPFPAHPADAAYPTFQPPVPHTASSHSSSQPFAPAAPVCAAAIKGVGIDDSLLWPSAHIVPTCSPFWCYSRMYDVIPDAPPDFIVLPDGSRYDIKWQDSDERYTPRRPPSASIPVP